MVDPVLVISSRPLPTVSLPALEHCMGSKLSGSTQGPVFVHLVSNFSFVIKSGKHKLVKNSLNSTFLKEGIFHLFYFVGWFV